MTKLADERTTATNTGLAKVAVQCSADTFVVKIATFAKPENVSGNLNQQTDKDKQTDKCGQKNS
jgi:hypothetical protein